MTSGEHTKGADLLALADRVGKLTGPDVEVDAEIMAAFFRREERNIGCQEEQPDGSWAPVKDAVWVDPATDKWVCTHARSYTASLDEAITLVPKNHGWLVGNGRTRPDEPLGGAQIYSLDGKELVAESEAATPALALTAACLRARAQSRETTHG